MEQGIKNDGRNVILQCSTFLVPCSIFKTAYPQNKKPYCGIAATGMVYVLLMVN
jgi:hypothetical protein